MGLGLHEVGMGMGLYAIRPGLCATALVFYMTGLRLYAVGYGLDVVGLGLYMMGLVGLCTMGLRLNVPQTQQRHVHTTQLQQSCSHLQIRRYAESWLVG